MKKIFCSLLAMFLTTTFLEKVKAQTNLCPNGSFEDTISCPAGLTQIYKARGWQAFRWTPDYYNSCLGYMPFGYQQARTGEGFAGFLLYQKNTPLAKEQLGIQLTSPLSVGVKYYLTFFVSLAYKYNPANIAANKIGALFTTYQYHDSTGQMPFSNHAQVYSDSIITDSVNWTKISGSFIADTAYQFLIIGAFFDNAHIDTLNLANQFGNYISYYYVDDICLSTDSLFCNPNPEGINELTMDDGLEIYPNIIQNRCVVSTPNQYINSISLFSLVGNLLYSEPDIEASRHTLDFSFIVSGFYLIKVQTNKNSIYTQKIIINH